MKRICAFAVLTVAMLFMLCACGKTEMEQNTGSQTRSTSEGAEMNDPESRPVIAGKMEDMNQYEVVFVGFPIWWYVAPKIINKSN